MKRLNIAVLFGGCSAEYSVSLQSAFSILAHLPPEKYEIIKIGITDQGQWLRFYEENEKIQSNTWQHDKRCVPVIISPNRDDHGIIEFGLDGIRKTRLDVAFPVLHGKNGEDGTVQGLLALAGIPIAGCGVLSSALCMDKYKAHTIANAVAIKTPKSYLLDNNIDAGDALNQAEILGYPLFVKPVNGGSSIGITKVMYRNDLPRALKTAFSYDDYVVIEEEIVGVEVGCAIVGNDNLLIGQVDEIELSSGFFDFSEKYNLISSKIHMPARIGTKKVDEIKKVAATIYKTLGCRGFARVDLFLTPDGTIYFNEVNTIPGFIEHSRFPNMLIGLGLSFEDVLDRIICLAVKK